MDRKTLEIGGGNNPRFRPNMDVRKLPNVDIVADLVEPWPIKDGEYHEIFCAYAIEHIPWRKADHFASELFRILAGGGTATIITANLLEQCRKVALSGEIDEKSAELIFGSQDYKENSHASGYSPEYAHKLFSKAGFKDILVHPHSDTKTDMIIKLKKSIDETKAETFGREYFDVGGEYRDGYMDFSGNIEIANDILSNKVNFVLELGCGRGYIVKRLEDAGVFAFGMDISKHCYMTRVTNRVLLLDITETPWPFRDGHFDFCYSVDAVRYIPKDKIDKVLGEIKRVSKSYKNYSMADHFVLAPPGGDGKVKLNIGSFTTMFWNGWINIDIINLSGFAQKYKYIFSNHDVSKRIPWPDNSVDLIYSSHFIEHLSGEEGDIFLSECKRVLKPEGIGRISCPDSELLGHMMVDNKLGIFDDINGDCAAAESQLEKLNALLFNNHKSVYTKSKLANKAMKAGLKAKAQSFQIGDSKQITRETIDMFPDLSMYVEIQK